MPSEILKSQLYSAFTLLLHYYYTTTILLHYYYYTATNHLDHQVGFLESELPMILAIRTVKRTMWV